jgi:hypothetical protein
MRRRIPGRLGRDGCELGAIQGIFALAPAARARKFFDLFRKHKADPGATGKGDATMYKVMADALFGASRECMASFDSGFDISSQWMSYALARPDAGGGTLGRSSPPNSSA